MGVDITIEYSNDNYEFCPHEICRAIDREFVRSTVYGTVGSVKEKIFERITQFINILKSSDEEIEDIDEYKLELENYKSYKITPFTNVETGTIV